MKLSPPKQVTFIIAVVIALLGLLGNFGVIPGLSAALAFWLVVIGFIVLALANIMEGL